MYVSMPMDAQACVWWLLVHVSVKCMYSYMCAQTGHGASVEIRGQPSGVWFLVVSGVLDIRGLELVR